MEKFEIVCRKAESLDPRSVVITNSDYAKHKIAIRFFTSNEYQSSSVHLDEDMIVMLENALSLYREKN